MKPAADFSLTSQTLTISPTAIPGSPPGIMRVYNFSTPVAFAGVAGLYYRPAELNGNTENTLQLAYGNATFVSVVGSTVDVAQHYISNTLPLTNFTSLTAAQENALPVSLIGFQVKRMETLTLLTWQTSEEKNSDYFEVQHSSDLRQWTALGTVKAAAESAVKKEYLFQDPAERHGTQYYRLKMVDTDGSYAFSKIRSVQLDGSSIISAYPNPVVDKLVIGSKEALKSVTVTDLAGRTLLELSKPEPGQEFSLKTYAAGTYLVRVVMVTGNVQTLKIFKQ